MARPKLSVMLAEAIAEEIVRRGLRPGMRLPAEAEMMRDFDVGRATLREALRLLEAQGLVRVKPGRSGGPVVAAPDAGHLARQVSLMLRVSGVSVDEVVRARQALEPQIAAGAARAGDAATVARLRELQAELERSVADERRYLEANRAFHATLAAAAGNRPLGLFWSAIGTIVDWHDVGVAYDEAARAAGCRAHRALTDAIAAGDVDAAARAMEAHMTALRDHLARRHPAALRRTVEVVSAGAPAAPQRTPARS